MMTKYQYCTHQGGSLDDTCKAATKSLGACPLHLSTFDLTRYGIVISGQAYQSVPQVLLEIDGDNIYAIAMMGLIYGRTNNLKGYETKSALFTSHIKPAIENGQIGLMMGPRATAGTAYNEKNGGLWLDTLPGTDLPVLLAISRIVVENGWQDADWIKSWANDKWGSSSGFGQGSVGA